MNNIHLGTQHEHRDKVNSFVAQKKSEQQFRVVDIGGAIYGWAWHNVDCLLDLMEPNCWAGNKFSGKFLQGDITTNQGWEELEKIVEENGKFDFSICRHTIEDLTNPSLTCEKLSQISKAGFLAIPSKYTELKKGIYPELPLSRGMHHHHWIFTHKDDKIYGLPKMGWTDSLSDESLEVDTSLGGVHDHPHTREVKQEFACSWEGEINIEFLLPWDYSGASPFIKSLWKKYQHPWDVWKHLLNDSD